jgi:hypothetical protein
MRQYGAQSGENLTVRTDPGTDKEKMKEKEQSLQPGSLLPYQNS